VGINGYFINGYWWLLTTIIFMAIGGYFKLKYHKLLMAIGDHSINGY